MGSPRLSWLDLLVFVQHAPRSSAVSRALIGEATDWGVTEHLLAAAVDALNGANWQRSGAKGKQPKPVKRPGAKLTGQKLGKGAIPAADFAAWWDNN